MPVAAIGRRPCDVLVGGATTFEESAADHGDEKQSTGSRMTLRIGALTVEAEDVTRPADAPRRRALTTDRTPGLSGFQVRTTDLSRPDFVQTLRSVVQQLSVHRYTPAITAGKFTHSGGRGEG